jgi:hypothetical protein
LKVFMSRRSLPVLPSTPGRTQSPSTPRPTLTDFSETHVVKTLRPLQAGALKLSEKYGPGLVCVRQRHDLEGGLRYTTVELVVSSAKVKRRNIVNVKIAFNDTTRRHLALRHGARWLADRKVWQMTQRSAEKAGLADCIEQK